MIASTADPSAFTPPVQRRAVWLSLDLGALAGALDGTRPLARGDARLGASPPGPRRVPASAFVPVSAPARPTVAPAPPGRAGWRRLAVVGGNAGLPRRHKVMLAVAAAVMALGFLRAGAGRPVPVAGPAPAALPAAG